MSEEIKKYIVGKDIGIEIPYNKIKNVSDGDHTFDELYDHRVLLFLTLMVAACRFYSATCGWSRRHYDGELCFGGGWYIGWIVLDNKKEIRYHFPESYITESIMRLERGI